jgi:hypothetical protein
MVNGGFSHPSCPPRTIISSTFFFKAIVYAVYIVLEVTFSTSSISFSKPFQRMGANCVNLLKYEREHWDAINLYTTSKFELDILFLRVTIILKTIKKMQRRLITKSKTYAELKFQIFIALFVRSVVLGRPEVLISIVRMHGKYGSIPLL